MADEIFLYMTTIGNKTGQPRPIEIWFVEHAGCHYMVAEHLEATSWVKNIQANPAVTYSVGNRDDHEALLPVRSAVGRVLSRDAEPELAAAVSKLMDDKYEWSDGLIVELKPI
ncbi:MAG: nitroreductase/quinone reductase family protein [Anaerolineae bacterium]